MTVTGNVTGGTTSTTGVGIFNNSTGAVTIAGDVTATTVTNGAVNNSTGGLRIGLSGSVSTVTNVAAIPAISGPWMVVAGAGVAVVVPTDAAFPAFSGGTTTLDINGATMGDGLILLSDIASVVGAQIAAANSA